MQTNYMRGRSFEYTVKRKLEGLGYYVIRSYGSHGVFDLIAVPPLTEANMRARLIQCKKRDYLHPEERAKIVETANTLHGVPLLATKDKENGRVVFKEIALPVANLFKEVA